MNTSRATALPLLLFGLTSACTIIEKDLLEPATDTGAIEPTTGADEASTGSTAPTGDDGASEATGTASDGSSTGDDGATGTSDDEATGTTGSMASDLLMIAPDASPMCMPMCVKDQEPETTVLQPACDLYVVDLAAKTEAPIVPCDELNFKWLIPAGAPRCFAPLIDRDNQTPGQHDQLSAACSELGFNAQLLIVGEPVPLDLFIGADCESSANPGLDCPDL